MFRPPNRVCGDGTLWPCLFPRDRRSALVFNRTVSAKPAKPARSTAAVSKQPGKTWILLDETGDSWALGRTMKAFVTVLLIASALLVPSVPPHPPLPIPLQALP